jgi:demethylmenaquinone methyltransferase/2-methoxy-6-polyprenyl-1,4-benzoquinol methylase
MNTLIATAKNRYNHTAWFYEPLAAVYSFGKIRASKLHELQYLHAGQRVLYAGVGGGEDAVRAAEIGAQITCIDLAAAMLQRVERKLKDAEVSGELICGDLLQHGRSGYYDVVCANYFLNVFTTEVMQTMLDHLIGLLKPGGLLLVADFAVPQGNPLLRATHTLYYRIANVFYWVISNSDLHSIYDYSATLPRHGLNVREVARHRLFPGGPRYFQTVIAQKPA